MPPTTVSFIGSGANVQDVYRAGGGYPPGGDIRHFIDATPLYASKTYNSGTFAIFNLLLAWDTASIPDGTNIIAASLRLFNVFAVNADARSFVCEYYDWDGVSGSDWSAVAPTSPICSIDLSSVSDNSTITLPIGNLSGINKAGFTKIRGQISGGAPAATGGDHYNYLSMPPPSIAGAELIVTYSTPPVASFNVSGTGLTRTFTSTSSVSSGSIVSSSWNLGDNTTASGASVTHQFAPGIYTVSLTVVNDADIPSTTSQTIVINTPAAPPQPTWHNLTQFQVVPTNFAFEGNMPIYAIPSGGTSPDQSIVQVHLQIYRADTGAMAYDAEFDTTPAERAQGYFSRAPLTLDPLLTYKTKFRLKDNFNQYSLFAAELTFTVTPGPSPPTLLAPLGKLNSNVDIAYQGTYSHPNGLSANAMEFLIRDPGGIAITFDSGTLPLSVASGSNWSYTRLGAAPLSTHFTWQARLRDTAGAWGPYSILRAFSTNSPPNVPTGLSPAEGSITPSRVFSCSVSDPDGDPITAVQIELVNASTGAVVAGYPKQMIVAANGASASFSAPSGDMTLGVQYRYRCRATDGFAPGYGSWSNYVTFLYQVVPSVALVVPSSVQRRNLVREPSAEYAESSYWTELNETVSDYIERIGDGDADFGLYSWRGVASSTSTNARRGAIHAVDATKPYLLQTGFKKESGTAASNLRVLCYNASDVLLTTLYPSSLAACLNADVPSSWTTYGGIVWPTGSANSPSFPSGTTKVRIEEVPSLTAAVVRYDSVAFEQVPLFSAADWATMQAFFGYFDGDAPGSVGIGGYQWLASAGSSESAGLNVLTAPGTPLVISYSSSGGFAKTQDRVTIERWDNDEEAWTSANEPAWVSSARTIIPFPSGLPRNENRYRVLVEAKDVNGAIGNSGYVEFDARFEGPPQLGILVATPNTARASIDLLFEASGLPSIEFGGIEIEVRSTDGTESAVIAQYLGSVLSTTYSYPFPVSGKEYELSVRQIKNVGGEQVEGRWTRVRVTCEYPYPFLKDAEDPTLYVAYDVPPQSYDQDAPGEKFFPWGSLAPVHPVGELRAKSGKEDVALYQEPGLMAPESERWSNLKEILVQRRTICLLPMTPEPSKIFASIVGNASFGLDDLRKKVVSFSWEETVYSEDFYERNGTA